MDHQSLIKENLIPCSFGLSFLLGFVVLRFIGSRNRTFFDRLFGAWFFLSFFISIAFDSYFCYTPKLVPLGPNEKLPANADALTFLKHEVRKMWLHAAAADTRLLSESYLPYMKAGAWCSATAGSFLFFMTFFGHLIGSKWSHGIQIAAATLQMSMIYNFCMTEYLDNFVHIKNMTIFLGMNAPFFFMSSLAILQGIGRMCCGSSAADQQMEAEKKKKKKQ